MPCDCSDLGLDEVFGERVARHDVRRFLKRGLPQRARRLVLAVEGATPLGGMESLEIGAGAGGLSVTLLERGISRATAVEAAPAFAAAARSLGADRGVAERFDIIAADFAASPDAAGAADVVVLDRVICCYPDLRGMLQPAAGHARRVIALSYPRDAWWARLMVRAANAGMALMRRRFRMHFHEPAGVRRLLADSGFTTRVVGYAGIWELLVGSKIEAAGQSR